MQKVIHSYCKYIISNTDCFPIVLLMFALHAKAATVSRMGLYCKLYNTRSTMLDYSRHCHTFSQKSQLGLQSGFLIDLNFQDVMTSKLKDLDVSVQNLEVIQ